VLLDKSKGQVLVDDSPSQILEARTGTRISMLVVIRNYGFCYIPWCNDYTCKYCNCRAH